MHPLEKNLLAWENPLEKNKLADLWASSNTRTVEISFHYYMKLKFIAVLQFISQGSSTLGWQHPLLATVSLPELLGCATIKSQSMKLDTLQFLQNSLEVSLPHPSLTYIRSVAIIIVSKTSLSLHSLLLFQHAKLYILRTIIHHKKTQLQSMLQK